MAFPELSQVERMSVQDKAYLAKSRAKHEPTSPDELYSLMRETVGRDLPLQVLKFEARCEAAYNPGHHIWRDALTHRLIDVNGGKI